MADKQYSTQKIDVTCPECDTKFIHEVEVILYIPDLDVDLA